MNRTYYIIQNKSKSNNEYQGKWLDYSNIKFETIESAVEWIRKEQHFSSPLRGKGYVRIVRREVVQTIVWPDTLS